MTIIRISKNDANFDWFAKTFAIPDNITQINLYGSPLTLEGMGEQR